jgi:DNA-directed RNA polymerase subunit beta'
VMKEGQRLEATLHDSLGSKKRKDIVFEAAETVIVKAGEEVANSHISEVQTVVKQRLNEIEDEFKQDLEREIAELDMAIEKARAESDLKIQGLNNQMEDYKEAAHGKSTQLREELYDLQPFTFLSESRYRELKSRWGQVFRADMGAEAFYDILRRLDLDQLSEDLWTEVRTTKSKQKRKKATNRLKVVAVRIIILSG